MADFDSSLPIRTEADGDVVAKISDATITTQQLKVNADGSIDTNFAAGAAIEITDGTDTLAVEADGSINVNAAFAAGTKVRLTDGVEDSEINASGELQVRDDDANTLLGTIDADTSTIAGDTTSIDSKTPALGGALTAASVPVNIASDQTVPVSAVSLPLPTGAATAANQLPDGHNVTIDNASGGAAVNIQDGGNSITVDGAVTVSATDLDVRDLTSASDSVEVLQDTHDDLNLNANLQVGDADVANGNPVPISDAGGSLTVDATNLDVRDLVAATDKVAIQDTAGDELAINTDGSINVVVSEDVPGDEIVSYNTSASVNKNASVNHDYTVTAAKTFTGMNAWISASGKLKAQLLINGSVKWVGFNSTANPNIDIPLDKMAKAAATQVIRITITNLDSQQDVYSTLTGVEV